MLLSTTATALSDGQRIVSTFDINVSFEYDNVRIIQHLHEDIWLFYLLFPA